VSQSTTDSDPASPNDEMTTKPIDGDVPAMVQATATGGGVPTAANSRSGLTMLQKR
jgi:hypothetical protein